MWITLIIAIGICALIAGFSLGWFLGTRAAVRREQATEEQLKTAFQSLASEQMDKNTERFFVLAGERDKYSREMLSNHAESLEKLVKPLAQKLTEFDTQRQEMYGRLANELKRVTEANEKLRVETLNLSNALRQPQVRGRWGETTLRRVVELAGMVAHVDFEEQVSATTDTGRLRPDMIINLPNGHSVVVDAKVALDAYLQANEETDGSKRDESLKRHARHMRTHMQMLSQKRYWEQFTAATEFVVMFVPGDHFLTAALQNDPTLIDDGMKDKVVIATPSTLIALLRAIEFGWRQVALQENAREISNLGKELYTRANVFIGHLSDIKKGLESAIGAFNKAIGSFQRNLLPGLRKFRELRADDGTDVKELGEIEAGTRSLPDREEG